MLPPGQETREETMRIVPLMTLALIGVAGLGAASYSGRGVAQSPPEVLNVLGEWSGMSETIVFGADAHNPGDGTAQDKPRLHEAPFTLIVEGQDGRRFWGKVKSKDFAEPFAALFSSSHVFGYGADTDGFYHFRSHEPGRLELCYTQPATNPAKSIVAACTVFTRAQP
jgi:hypothetical protein